MEEKKADSSFKFELKKDGNVIVITFEKDKVPITWETFISLTEGKNSGFCETLREAMISTKFPTLYFNCPPLTSKNLGEVFEMALMDAPRLSKIRTDPYTFEKKFKNKDLVSSFENLGGDALMVCPVPLKDQNLAIYSSLGPFINGAPMKQQLAFWGDVGSGLKVLNERRTVWLNTEGSGVHYLHMRMDSRPKYYHYDKFSNPYYYKK